MISTSRRSWGGEVVTEPPNTTPPPGSGPSAHHLTTPLAELSAAYAGRRVLVTGHTGFKGSWLTLWLEALGADVTGYALPPAGARSLFDDADVARSCSHLAGDLRDAGALAGAVRRTRPDIIFHLAAQALVRRSYERPLETIETNLLGTAHLLEAVRLEGRPCAVVVVSSDKCYENREWVYGYRENEPMGGHDIYSMSKGAVELLTHSYRRSFFSPARIREHGVAVATVRAGNVVGGGDWATDRIVPDAIRSLEERRRIPVRNPDAVRPWQHVLEPLGGYLLLGSRLMGAGTPDPSPFCDAWNFGPPAESAQPVRSVVETIIDCWGDGAWTDVRDPSAPHEAGILRLCTDKARTQLGWAPRWGFEETLARTVAWYRARYDGAATAELRSLALRQIDQYMARVGSGCAS